MITAVMGRWWCRWGATPLQDAYLSGDPVMCALLERAGGMKADHPAIKEKLPNQEVSLAAHCAPVAVGLKHHVQCQLIMRRRDVVSTVHLHG